MINKNEHVEYCKAISNELNEYYSGLIYNVDGELVNCLETDNPDIYDYEACSLWDYIDNSFDIEYTVSLGSDYIKGCRIMIACGGPNVYINTLNRQVELFWWNECGSYPIEPEVADAIDEIVQEYKDCY